MSVPKLTKLELRIMGVLWDQGPLSVREIQEAFPTKGRPAYTTIQTTIYRLEKKEAVRIVKRIGNANIFEAVVSRGSAHRRIVDELLGLFGGGTRPLMAHLIETGRLTLEDVEEARAALRKKKKSRKSQ